MTRRRVISISVQYYSASGITIYPLYKTKIHFSRILRFILFFNMRKAWNLKLNFLTTIFLSIRVFHFTFPMILFYFTLCFLWQLIGDLLISYINFSSYVCMFNVCIYISVWVGLCTSHRKIIVANNILILFLPRLIFLRTLSCF